MSGPICAMVCNSCSSFCWSPSRQGWQDPVPLQEVHQALDQWNLKGICYRSVDAAQSAF